jgi:aspartate carbamoyltransferase catalytic subunit
MKDIISIKDFSRVELDSLIQGALDIKQGKKQVSLEGKSLASLFFENSTRTRTSTETAARNVGMVIDGFTGTEGTSVKKGEPLADTVRMFSGYGYDMVALRHSLEGSARFVSELINKPVINCGDGANIHPTQTLLDLVTIKEKYGAIDGLKIALCGDLKYGRTVHSLLQGLQHYDVEVTLVSPENLAMPDWRVKDYERFTGRKVIITEDLQGTLNRVDFFYMTRIQRERFPEGLEGDLEFQKVSGVNRITAHMLKHGKPTLSIGHPLPRYKNSLEIAMDVDNTKHALYIVMAENGVPAKIEMFDYLSRWDKQLSLQKEVENMLWNDLPIPNGNKKGDHLIYRLDNGILIDHIEHGKGLQVYDILGLKEHTDLTIVPALGIRSTQYGRKDVIAIHDFNFSPEQLYKVALVSKEATINQINNDSVVKKGKVILPKMLEGMISCNNHNCVSNPTHYEHVVSKFRVESQDPLSVRCHYCDTPHNRNEIKLQL